MVHLLVARQSTATLFVTAYLSYRSNFRVLFTFEITRDPVPVTNNVIARPFQILLGTPVACGRLPIPLKRHVIPAFQNITLNRDVGAMQRLLDEISAKQDIVNIATHQILQSIFSPQW
jgi:hypothetical protein